MNNDRSMNRWNKTVSRRRKLAGKKKSKFFAIFSTTPRMSAHMSQQNTWDGDTPNIQLSKAFFIVLLLHVVVIGGVIVFHNFQTRQPEVSNNVGYSSSNRYELYNNNSVPKTNFNDEGHLRLHMIISGETLTNIAEHYNVTVSDLAQVNNAKPTDTLIAGHTLQIPQSLIATAPIANTPEPVEVVAPAPTPVAPVVQKTKPVVVKAPVVTNKTVTVKPKPKPVNTTKYRIHRLQPGETLYQLHRKYGVSVAAIRAANGNIDPTTIPNGSALKIPIK